MTKNIELEQAKDRRDDDALKPVRAAGNVGNLVGDLAHDQRHPEGHHQPREVGPAQDEEARREAENRGAKPRQDKREHRLVDDAVLGQERGQIGSETEKGGMPKRDDAGIAENEVEREREQGKPSDFGEDQMPIGQQKEARQCRKPKGVLERTPSPARGEAVSNLSDQRRWHREPRGYLPAARANRPCGRRIRTMIMMV